MLNEQQNNNISSGIGDNCARWTNRIGFQAEDSWERITSMENEVADYWQMRRKSYT